ncbi:MAG TPA: hypothetical protein DCS36_18745, partial [Sphingobacterium sp.]|nr:hypothetical protein [Sphingobacterium sp.]
MKKIETIVPYNQNVPLHIGAFIEAIEQLEMHFNAASMEHFFESDKELGMAIKRAMAICRNLGFPLEQHFGKRYVSNSDSHTLKIDWQMSKSADCRNMIDGNPDNPVD